MRLKMLADLKAVGLWSHVLGSTRQRIRFGNDETSKPWSVTPASAADGHINPFL